MDRVELDALIEAAQAAPNDVSRLRDLLNGAAQVKDASPALDYVASLRPSKFDRFTRSAVGRFLLHGSRAAAARWLYSWWMHWRG